MALTVTNRGAGTNNTAATTTAFSPGSNCTAGALVVVCISADNNSSGGATNNISSVTDTAGNIWTLVPSTNVVFDNGAAAAGIQGSIYATTQHAGTLTTGSTITITYGTATTADTWVLREVTASAGYPRVKTGGAKGAGATATAATSGATGTIEIGEALIAAIYIEAGTTQTCTGDSDTTNGSWSTLQYQEIGTTTSGNCIASQTKVQTTAASTQTYDVTLGISSDYHSSWAVIYEVPSNSCGCYGTMGWW